MSRSNTYNITCPFCGTQQSVELYESLNAADDPHLKDALMKNTLNRVDCSDCEASFRVDMPLLYSDPEHNILIHWMPETEAMPREQILEDFDRTLEQMNEIMPDDVSIPQVRLVLSRVELVELLFMIEAGFNPRVVEYVKYSIYSRNPEKVDPKQFRLLLNVESSNAEELCFVLQNAQTQELGSTLSYGRPAYDSMCELYAENPDEFIDMFPGPCLSARNLLLDEME
ncbi:MAG: CpXC domain-containing protein [Pontiellaceae bacterium]|nr:CpXC domain-containing protein [Pontiellaceae bacterium]